MFPRHDCRKFPDDIKVSCNDLKKTDIIAYDSGRRAVIAGVIAVAVMAALGQYQPAGKADQTAAREPEGKAAPLEAVSRDKSKIRPAGQLKPRSYARQVRTAGSRHNIDPRLIHAVIEVESRGDPNAVSPKGAKGLMQITPGICRRYGVRNPFDIEQNVNAGCAYLAHLLESVNGDLERALAAYNCGLGRALAYNEMPPLSETRMFVEKILSRYRSKMIKDLSGPGRSG